MTDIGYRKPPVANRFKKGSSGNPKGRPKGSKNFATLLEKELKQTVVVNENGKRRKVTRLQAIVKRLVAGALQGEPKPLMTMLEILRRTGGFEAETTDNLLPDNFESVLEAFVQKRATSTKP